ncbi:inositol oxygenase family protein [Nonomuraea sp. NPDC049607]|uniref:inositol oxygenase family protein n=1 Tax=Nonomuraea sp. NPDC049607 TaxID=3154732 RepID=UPI0034415A55
MTVDELMDLLARCEDAWDAPDRTGDPVPLLDHGLQVAAVLRDRHPGDRELQVAGLVHDLGHLLAPGDEAGHAARPGRRRPAPRRRPGQGGRPDPPTPRRTDHLATDHRHARRNPVSLPTIAHRDGRRNSVSLASMAFLMRSRASMRGTPDMSRRS